MAPSTLPKNGCADAVLVTMLMTPPIAPSPYSTAPLIAAGDLDALDAVERDRGKIEPLQIEVLKAPAVHQNEDVRLRECAKAAQIDHIVGADRAAEQVHDLHAGDLR